MTGHQPGLSSHQTAPEHVCVIPVFLWMPFQWTLLAIFSFGGCGKNSLEVFFLSRQTSAQGKKEQLEQDME